MKQIGLLILVAVSFSACNYYSANYYFEKACELEEQEQYEEAILQLNKVIVFEPGFEMAYLNRAIDKAIIGQYESAIDDLDVLIKLRPDAIEPYVWRAEYNRMLEQHEEAMLDVVKALSLKDANYDGTDVSGPQEFNQNELYPAGANFNIEMEFIVFERAAANYHLGNFIQALSDLEFCKQEKHEPINTHYYMGMTLLELGKKDEACKELWMSYELGQTAAKKIISEHCK